MSKICCPKCGNKNLQVINETNVQTQGKNYSTGKGCLGYLLLGPLGLLCGSCGKGQTTTTTNTTYWTCPECGTKFRTPDDLRADVSMNNKKFVVVLICAIIIAFCGIFFFASPYDEMNTFGILAEVIAVITIIMAAVLKATNKKLETEIRNTEECMKRFLNK